MDFRRHFSTQITLVSCVLLFSVRMPCTEKHFEWKVLLWLVLTYRTILVNDWERFVRQTQCDYRETILIAAHAMFLITTRF